MQDKINESLAKIEFKLEQDEDGYPPAKYETVWASENNGHYIIENVPFFARGVSYGDVVSAKMVDGFLSFQEVIRRSGHSTVRIGVYNLEEIDSICKELNALGCDIEKSHLPSLFSVDIPPDANIPAIREYLEKGAEDEQFGYEEASVTWL